MITYSIILPVYNQLDFIPWHIKFYNALWKYRQDFEVIFEDDGSSDNTRKYMEDGSNDRLFSYQYNWTEDKGFTVAAAKNRAIERAKGKWLLILDGDTFIDPQTLKAYDHIKKDENTVYFGKRYPVELKKLDQALHYGFPAVVEKKADFRGFLQPIPPAPFYHFSGANFLVSRKIAQDKEDIFTRSDGLHTKKGLQYAPDDWVGYGYDDYYMAINYLLHGKKFEPVNDSIAYHCEDEPKPGHLATRERLNAFIKEHETELQQLGGVRYF